MVFKVLLVPARKVSHTKLWRQNISIPISKLVVFSIVSHCGHGCDCHIELISLVQEPCHNSTALLRYGQKSRITFVANYTIFTAENGQIFLLYLDEKKKKNVNISGSTPPIVTKQELLGS